MMVVESNNIVGLHCFKSSVSV